MYQDFKKIVLRFSIREKKYHYISNDNFLLYRKENKEIAAPLTKRGAGAAGT